VSAGAKTFAAVAGVTPLPPVGEPRQGRALSAKNPSVACNILVPRVHRGAGVTTCLVEL
jgi:hypothetical protein